MADITEIQLDDVEAQLEEAIAKSTKQTGEKDKYLFSYKKEQSALNVRIEKLTAMRNALRSADPMLKKLAQQINISKN